MAFNVQCFKNTADTVVVDKSNNLIPVATYSGTLKDSTSIIAPDIILEINGVPEFNYVYIADFKRYYYVDSIVSIRNNLWAVSLSCDVLYTYRNAILNCEGFIDRCENGYNSLVIDPLITIRDNPVIQSFGIPNEVFTDSFEYIISGFQIHNGGNYQ